MDIVLSCIGTNIGQTFEDLCRSHIQAFVKSAEKYAQTTKLIERISRWQAHLAPILEEEERKASFDIHRYSEMLLQLAMTSVQEKKRRYIDGPDENQDHESEMSVHTNVIDCCG